MLAAGLLDRLVTIQSPPNPDDQNQFGELSDQGATVAEVWAEVKGLDVTIRWRPDIRPDYRFLVDGRELLIAVTVTEIGRKDGLLVKCREKVK